MYLKEDPGSGAKEHFFGVRVFNTNAKRYLRQTLKQCYTINKNEKKHHCKNRIMEVDLGSFTPLVFTVRIFKKSFFHLTVKQQPLAIETD